MMAFLHLMAAMLFMTTVMMGLVVGQMLPTTPMGFAMTRTPGSS